jgi:nucleotide-binding universal stress UspA family protein
MKKRLEETKEELKKEAVSASVVTGQGNPARVILNAAKELKFDLLIAGALERENLQGYYIGSVARKLMRNSPCSLLILTPDFSKRKLLQKIYMTTNFSEANEPALLYATDLSRMNGGSLGLIREFQVPGLAMTVNATGSLAEAEDALEQWKKEEQAKMQIYIREHDFSGIPVSGVCIYGKEGFESGAYAKEQEADLLVMTAPERKLWLLDRIFQHDVEYILKELPCSLLLVR